MNNIYIEDINNILNKHWNIIPENKTFSGAGLTSYALNQFQNIVKTFEYRKKLKEPESKFYKKLNIGKKYNSIEEFYNEEENDENYKKWKILDNKLKKKYLIDFCDRKKDTLKLNDTIYEILIHTVIEHLENGNFLNYGKILYNYKKKQIINIQGLKIVPAHGYISL